MGGSVITDLDDTNIKMSASKQWGSDSKKLKDDSTDVWLPPKHSTEKASPDEQIEHLRIMFESVEDMLNSPDYDDELKDELSETCPKYMDVFLTSKRDLLRNDCGIVVTGETSAGKSTLINQLVGNKVCTTGNCATTGKITRIRNSEKMEIKCYTKDDILKKQEEVKDVNKIKSIIRKLTDINKNPNDKQDIYYVDVNLPVPILKGNVIIVDTPGIGENERLDKILLDFLPHAVSFVFVVNARNAGGIHENRFSKILKSIIDNREKMPCFDPRQVLILTSQWDIVDNNDSSSDEDDNSSDDISSDENEISSDKDDMGKSEKENQHTKTWNKIIENLESSWGWFDVENVFRVSLKQVNI
ncbi:bacterial dynamin-like protein [Mytilus edulis]|uniref:bacterial dynamin-like protein n=1 Tax=Mytilus edulis TaxID=6550 RepID=UPI0039EE146D